MFTGQHRQNIDSMVKGRARQNVRGSFLPLRSAGEKEK